MAAKDKKTSEAKLLPSTLIVPINGEDVRVPTDRYEAAVQNVLLVAQFRQVLQNALKTYKDKEMIPTPKELNDMASAIEKCNNSMSGIFEKIENPMGGQGEKDLPNGEIVDFSKITNVTNGNSEGKTDPQPPI